MLNSGYNIGGNAMMTATEFKNSSMSFKAHDNEAGWRLCSLCEAMWFLLTLLLFIVLGPFAAPVALVGIFTCQNREERDWLDEPESVESL